MDVLEDKTYKQAWEELFDRAKQELHGEIDKRLAKVRGNTVASLVADIPDERQRERVRQVLLMGKVALVLELAKKRQPLLWFVSLSQGEVDELSDFIIEIYQASRE